MKTLAKRALIASIFLCMTSGSVAAEEEASDSLRPNYLLTASINRERQSLSGAWTYSKDLYRTGLTDIDGRPAKPRLQRYRDIDVQSIEAASGIDFLEFDMDRGPTMMVPGAWNAAVPELRYYNGLVWFQKKFTPTRTTDGRAFLEFGAVNYRAHVYLNGEEVGTHEGGFTPFVFEVTDLLREGENRLVVGVDSAHDDQTIPTPITDWDNYGGITRPVHIVYTPRTFVDDATLRLTPDGLLTGSVTLDGPEANGTGVHVAIEGLDAEADVTTGSDGQAMVSIPAPDELQRWSPDAPKLYDVRFSTVDDQLEDQIGFRNIEVSGSDILLNSKPIFLRGIALHEEEFGTNPARRITPQAARSLLGEVKNELHGNYVRLSHYPHARVMTRMADELGLLVWSEIPVYWTADWDNPEVLEKAKRMQSETYFRDRNRASVILWSIGNETPVSEDRTAFHTALAEHIKALDADRLVSAALLVEGDEKNGHPLIRINDPLVDELDVMAVNSYAGWYGSNTLDELPSIEWDVPEDKPLLFSEFGAGALAGFHDPEGKQKWSEEFQAEFYRQTLSMIEKIPNLRGMSPWILKDFRSPRREHPVFQNGWNRKGLMSETGVPKIAFGVLADYYWKKMQSEPVSIESVE